MKDTFRLCKNCGKQVGVIMVNPCRGVYVDADPVEVYPDPIGDIYYRIDGTKMRGRTDDRWSNGTVKPEFVWKMHRCHEV